MKHKAYSSVPQLTDDKQSTQDVYYKNKNDEQAFKRIASPLQKIKKDYTIK
jgi:hypothetical protein